MNAALMSDNRKKRDCLEDLSNINKKIILKRVWKT
jgi:hypothetical protein